MNTVLSMGDVTRPEVLDQSHEARSRRTCAAASCFCQSSFPSPRSSGIDSEGFWGCHEFSDRMEAEPQLRDWERRYNHERFSLALAGRTPAEKLASSALARET